MTTRFRTLLLAGAASLAVSAAVAQVTQNGVPSTISQIVQVVWNGQNISTANPLPVNVVSGGGGSGSTGSVTAAGTNGTQAQAVQGITGGVPVAIQGGNASAVKTDGSATTQPVSGTVATSNGALDATVTARLGTLGQKASAGSAPVVIASDQSAVPISTTRSTTYADAAFSGIAANGALYGTTRGSLVGASKFNVWAGCSVAGASVLLQGSNDAFTTTAVTVASATVAASSAAANGETTAAGTSITAPVLFSSYRGRIVNGSTANNCTIVSSFTAN
jgi:hypothetical protein